MRESARSARRDRVERKRAGAASYRSLGFLDASASASSLLVWGLICSLCLAGAAEREHTDMRHDRRRGREAACKRAGGSKGLESARRRSCLLA